jgi:hypothetical protein
VATKPTSTTWTDPGHASPTKCGWREPDKPTDYQPVEMSHQCVSKYDSTHGTKIKSMNEDYETSWTDPNSVSSTTWTDPNSVSSTTWTDPNSVSSTTWTEDPA